MDLWLAGRQLAAQDLLWRLRCQHPHLGIPHVYVIADPLAELKTLVEHIEAGTIEEYRRSRPKVVRFPRRRT